MKTKKLITILVIVVIAILAWAPWFSNEESKSIFLTQYQDYPGQDVCPEIYSAWMPFGRWITNCEGGWIVTFWGSVLFE